MNSIRLRDKEFELFIPQKAITEGINKIAKQINDDFSDKEPLFVIVLNGAFMFASELIGQFNHPCEVTFIRLKSYEGTNRGGKMKEIHGLIEDVKDRNLVIIEDIIDTGHTMDHLLKYMKEKQPASISIATLLFKPDALELDVKPDYVVKEIPNDFIVGYGLDFDGHGRNLREIYKIKP